MTAEDRRRAPYQPHTAEINFTRLSAIRPDWADSGWSKPPLCACASICQSSVCYRLAARARKRIRPPYSDTVVGVEILQKRPYSPLPSVLGIGEMPGKTHYLRGKQVRTRCAPGMEFPETNRLGVTHEVFNNSGRLQSRVTNSRTVFLTLINLD